MPRVSVIIPTFNRAAVLKRALDSVDQQTFCDWELVVIDDGSTDETAQVIENWAKSRPQKRVRYFKIASSGVSRARNIGIAHARADLLAFLDSDDEWLPRKLETQLALTELYPLVHGEEIWIRNGVRVNPMKKHAKSGGRIFTRCVDLCCISPSATLVKRDIMEKAGGFREDFPVCEDYELWLRLSSRIKVGFIETPIIKKYGGHEDQLSRRYKAMDYFRVKALMPFLEASHISHDEQIHVAHTIQNKCEILLQGYRKHDNRVCEDEVAAFLARTEQWLRANSDRSSPNPV